MKSSDFPIGPVVEGNMGKVNKRRSLLWLSMALLLLLPFQNCGQSFKAVDGATTMSSSQDVSGLPGGTPTSGGGSGGGSTTSTTLPVANPCLATDVGNPEMVPASVTTATVLSGRGTIGGRKDSSPITIQYTKSNAPSNCQQAVTVQCNRMAGSTVTAVNTAGVRTAIAGADITCNRSPATANPGSSIAITFRANDNDTDKQCFDGTATFQISLKSNADPNKNSSTQNVTVTFKNNCYPEQISNETLDAYDQMGTAVAVDGTTAAVIAPGDDGDSNQTSAIGAIYIYRKGNDGVWNRTQILRTDSTSIVSDRGAAGDTPAAIALKNGVLVVGSEFNSSNAGAIYIFKDGGGSFSMVRKIAGAVAGGRLGRGVATDGSQIAAGAPGENSSAGAVHIFDANSFTETAHILSPLPANAYFGSAVAIENSLLAVGAPVSTLYRDTMTGDLVVYRNSGGWSEMTSNPLRSNKTKTGIAVKDPTGKAGSITIGTGSELGTSVAILNGAVIVGSPGFMTGTKKTGLALILSSDMVSLQTLTDVSGSEGRFGSSVSLGSSGAFVGGPELRNRGGAVDQFSLSNGVYSFVRRISSTTGADNDQFGFGVATFGTDIVVGAKLKAAPNNASGAASFLTTVIP